jgi:1,4-alpha-glucan branching enzyme
MARAATQTIPVNAAASHASPAPAAQPAKPPIQAEPPEPLGQAAVAEKAPKPTATKTVNVGFALFEPDATQVSLCGDFNVWASGATPMKQHDGGHWETTVALAPGRYEYKFLVDGHWIPDPLAHGHVWNQHGTLNSVIEVRA